MLGEGWIVIERSNEGGWLAMTIHIISWYRMLEHR